MLAPRWLALAIDVLEAIDDDRPRLVGETRQPAAVALVTAGSPPLLLLPPPPPLLLWHVNVPVFLPLLVTLVLFLALEATTPHLVRQRFLEPARQLDGLRLCPRDVVLPMVSVRFETSLRLRLPCRRRARPVHIPISLSITTDTCTGTGTGTILAAMVTATPRAPRNRRRLRAAAAAAAAAHITQRHDRVLHEEPVAARGHAAEAGVERPEVEPGAEARREEGGALADRLLLAGEGLLDFGGRGGAAAALWGGGGG